MFPHEVSLNLLRTASIAISTVLVRSYYIQQRIRESLPLLSQ